MSASPLAVDITDILEYLICQKHKLHVFDILKRKKNYKVKILKSA